VVKKNHPSLFWQKTIQPNKIRLEVQLDLLWTVVYGLRHGGQVLTIIRIKGDSK